MKILFLDINGVLNSRNDPALLGFYCGISAAKVKLLNEIVDATGCKIVISSSWRYGRSVEKLQALLHLHGFVGEVVDKTPSLPLCNTEKREYNEWRVGIDRGCEIEKWLSDHKGNGITHYCILDDNADMTDEQLPRLVKTTWENGLEPQHVKLAIQILAPEGGKS
jgi:hypothetical protein